MARRVQLSEYLTNVRELLAIDPRKFGLMIERQVLGDSGRFAQFTLLAGKRGIVNK